MKFLRCAALLTVALAKKLTLRSAGTGKANHFNIVTSRAAAAAAAAAA